MIKTNLFRGAGDDRAGDFVSRWLSRGHALLPVPLPGTRSEGMSPCWWEGELAVGEARGQEMKLL